ncbi:hypothetical protein HCN44_010450 [Aphidius gifuensis]|uniref:Odorant-binding protein n=1 Tax=Aphidius gifuensis TaxID=684658 RepID=A0A835CPA2_APHGI|nr:hypothetical protein HCN44_010450 [Aphidius gifuensis]
MIKLYFLISICVLFTGIIGSPWNTPVRETREVESQLFPGEIDESFQVWITGPPSGDIVACYIENKQNSEYYLNFKYYDRESKQKRLILPADEFFYARASDNTCSFKIRSINYDFFDTWQITTEYENGDGSISSFVDEITIVHKIYIFPSDTVYVRRHETVILDFEVGRKIAGECHLRNLDARNEEEKNADYFDNYTKENFKLQQKRTCAFKITDADDETFKRWMMEHTYDPDDYYINRDLISFKVEEKLNKIVNTY